MSMEYALDVLPELQESVGGRRAGDNETGG
jgi:hypothetical protein